VTTPKIKVPAYTGLIDRLCDEMDDLR